MSEEAVLDAAFHVHSELGSGLLESEYEAAMSLDLQKRGFKVEQQKAIPVFFDGVKLDVGFRADLIVNGVVLVELKSVEAVTPVFRKIATNYLRLIPLRLGYLINFNVLHLRDGITRIVNGLDGKPNFPKRISRGVCEGSEVHEGFSTSPPSHPSSPLREIKL